jgi:hypothetical protein
MREFLPVFRIGMALLVTLSGATLAATDADFVATFHETYTKVESPPNLADYATTADYDGRYLGGALDKALENVTNERGGIAWGLASRMRSLNEMFRATGDVKYLAANLRCIEAVLAARDDKTGVKTWTDVVAPAWTSGKYAERGRAVFAVHTGVILYPMLDYVFLVNGLDGAPAELKASTDVIAQAAGESLAFHDRQWRDGPEAGAGHYIGLDQENVCENKPLPGNRLSAMGIALWMSWKVTGNETRRDRAKAIGHYVKNRLTPAPDGAYYWPYWLPIEVVTDTQAKEAVKGEDISHAALTMLLPILLAKDGEVFSREEMAAIGACITKGFGRFGDGVLGGDVTGNPAGSARYATASARWLPFVEFYPDAREPLVAFYRNYMAKPDNLAIPLLMRYGK